MVGLNYSPLSQLTLPLSLVQVDWGGGGREEERGERKNKAGTI